MATTRCGATVEWRGPKINGEVAALQRGHLTVLCAGYGGSGQLAVELSFSCRR